LPATVHDLTLTTLAYGGETLGRLEDGRAVFVPFALPGERVRVRLIQEKEHYTRGKLVEVLEAAPQRIAPRCKHFGKCGGCQYQHMPYEAQLTAKLEILQDQLARIGHIDNPPLRPAVASPRPWNYRNHVQFHLTEEGQVGYVEVGGGDDRSAGVLAIQECHLPEASINALWPQLEFEPDPNLDRISIRAGSDDDLLLALESRAAATPDLHVEAGISITHVFGGESLVLAGEDHVTLRVLNREFRVSAQSFFQVNTPVAEKMVGHILTYAPVPGSTVLDVYCGVGLFSAFLAPRCNRLIGIESSPAACADYEFNLEEFNNVELYEDAAERVLPALDARPDLVVLDPPRPGAQLAALDALVRMEPRRLAYVSCDPATLARDAKRLIQGGYQLREVVPFDLFPETYHIESISLFER
jgi:23S rRNA (uracil1939-C5)-methyltransferase